MADRANSAKGVDVAAEKQKAKRDAASAWTFRRLAEDCLKKAEGRLSKATLDGRQRNYVELRLPSWQPSSKKRRGA